MSTNTGVILLASRSKGDYRLDIEDNIGEGIHIHYNNIRLDYSIKELLSFATACQKALEELGFNQVTNKKQKLSVFISGQGYVEKEFVVEKSLTIWSPGPSLSKRTYEIWKDLDNNKYWALINQQIDARVTDNKEVNEAILEYSQQNNWVVETYRLASDYTLTKYYDGYYPVVINEPSTWFYDAKEYQERVISHYYTFGNPYRAVHCNDNGADKELPKSEHALENRTKFYNEAVEQHQQFSDATGCFFGDIQPNNFLANHDFSDIKIIDACSIEVGHIKDFVCRGGEGKWPLPESRFVGPKSDDHLYRNKYHAPLPRPR